MMTTSLNWLLFLCHCAHSLDLGVPVFTPGEGGYPCIRVPAIASTSSGTLVAFAECRNYTGDGCVPHNTNNKNIGDESNNRWICQKYSTDGGQTWSQHLSFPFGLSYTSQNPTIVFDVINKRLILQSNVYIGQPNETIYQVQSDDDGKTWTNLIDVGAQLLPQNASNYSSMFWPGPSTGLQLKNQSKNGKYGRLLWSGHTPQGSYIWYSDDYGSSYKFSSTPNINNYLPSMEEGALAELSNGSIIDNMRNSHYWPCDCRGFAVSNDYGDSFSAAYPSPTLISPECEGSTLSVDMNGEFMLFFSNPDSTTDRVNMTVKKSVDDGEHWNDGYHLCEQCGGGYSCLTTLPQPNNTHIGLLWETNSTDCDGWACQTVFSVISVQQT